MYPYLTGSEICLYDNRNQVVYSYNKIFCLVFKKFGYLAERSYYELSVKINRKGLSILNGVNLDLIYVGFNMVQHSSTFLETEDNTILYIFVPNKIRSLMSELNRGVSLEEFYYLRTQNSVKYNYSTLKARSSLNTVL